jgi:hypothetical protein
MAGEMVRKNVFYRCASRTMAPGSTALADHPATVNLREDVLASAVNGWVGELSCRRTSNGLLPKR